MPIALVALTVGSAIAGWSACWGWTARSRRDRRGAIPPTTSREAVLDTTLEHVDQGIMTVDAAGVVVAFNRRVIEMLDLPESLLASRPTLLQVLEHQWSLDEFSRSDPMFQQGVRAGGAAQLPTQYERERPNGSVLEVRSRLLPDGAMVRTYTDITERKNAEASVRRAAMVDDLTGLPTRLALVRALETDLARLTLDSEPLQLLSISLDRFRLVNDARGHEVGDAVLLETARRLRAICREPDAAFRVGGDEFALVVARADVESLAAEVLQRLEAVQSVAGGTLSVTVSIGAARAAVGSSAAELLRQADIALSRAKEAGRSQIRHYTPSMTLAREQRFGLEQAVRQAVSDAAFTIAYQPIVAVQTGNIVGFEALLRWVDPVRGNISPADFIPIAESTGLIVSLGRSVLEKACAEAASWANERTIAVNLSPAQLVTGDVVRTVQDTLQSAGLAPARLELEVTEGILLESSDAVAESIAGLRRLGVRLTIDDFGAGHAGLSYLRRFPFAKMKIDASFIRALGTGREADAIVEAILLLGQRLDMAVVAEGVETPAQLQQLRRMRCPYVQGYLTGRPMSPEQARIAAKPAA